MHHYRSLPIKIKRKRQKKGIFLFKAASILPMDALEIIRKQFEHDQYAKSFGIILDELTPTTIKMHMQLKPEMNNLFQRPHGGVIYSLADAAFSVLGNNVNNISVALDCTISYHASPEPKSLLRVEGEMVCNTRRTGNFIFKIYADFNNKSVHVATMMSTVYRTGKPIVAEDQKE
jgi:acyl-CoA thioesterase